MGGWRDAEEVTGKTNIIMRVMEGGEVTGRTNIIMGVMEGEEVTGSSNTTVRNNGGIMEYIFL